MEQRVLSCLDFKLCMPLPCHFVMYFTQMMDCSLPIVALTNVSDGVYMNIRLRLFAFYFGFLTSCSILFLTVLDGNCHALPSILPRILWLYFGCRRY